MLYGCFYALLLLLFSLVFIKVLYPVDCYNMLLERVENDVVVCCLLFGVVCF